MYEFVEVIGTNATLCIFDIDIVSLRFPFTFYVTPLDTLFTLGYNEKTEETLLYLFGFFVCCSLTC